MRWPAQVWRQYQTEVSVFINCGESVAVQIYGNFTREGAPCKSHCYRFFYINSEPPVWQPSWCSRHWLLKVLMQCCLQIGHTGWLSLGFLFLFIAQKKVLRLVQERWHARMPLALESTENSFNTPPSWKVALLVSKSVRLSLNVF